MNSNITAIILAAGQGKRLKKHMPKPCVNVASKPLIFHTLSWLFKNKVTNIIIVCGYKANFLCQLVKKFSPKQPSNFNIHFVHNKYWKVKENGYSAYLGLKHCSSNKFLLLMGDHYFNGSLKKLWQCTLPYWLIEVADITMEKMKPSGCTKLLIQGNKVLKSSKFLKKYNALDTGLFLGETKPVYLIARKLVRQNKTKWNDVVQYLVSLHQVGCISIPNFFWFGINTPAQLNKLNDYLGN